ncbi:molybdate transport system substrate-binding protein [Desulfohalotomaculum tongense]|uniref:molybdate ABC transporter substrate-binding protein n=1 Tax=Desulforadius tongensis TaxID=1216062 RepID=UPI001957E0CC|nr:molybdate ABC transporter substrate-binding protein [Desulforadius tongensis]MBM7855071.1 molybdate transport system substrate-binding protein [Desulforadius tongensis]
MKKLFVVITLLLCLMPAAAGCSFGEKETAAQKVELTVSTAASLTDVANELKAVYTERNPNVTINYNFASSGTLQKQIEEGAPVDVFISASKAKMDALAEKQLIIEDSRKNLVSNRIVLLVSKDSSIKDFSDLIKPEVSKISIGEPESVPAGRYGKEVLTSLNIWEQLQSKLLLAKTVRQVLSYVDTGNVDAGLVYNTDALLAKNAKVVAVAPENTHKPIIYPVAVLKSSRNEEEARKFVSFLASKEAAEIFAQYGFIPLNN